MIYILLILAILVLIAGVVARKQLSGITNEEEKRLVTARWQLVFSCLGIAIVIIAGIAIFAFL